MCFYLLAELRPCPHIAGYKAIFLPLIKMQIYDIKNNTFKNSEL